jgi:hypothetical protein
VNEGRTLNRERKVPEAETAGSVEFADFDGDKDESPRKKGKQC